MNAAHYEPAAPVTIVQEVLVSFGHKLYRKISGGSWHLVPSETRCGKWGEIPEADWQAAEAAAAAPVYTCAVPAHLGGAARRAYNKANLS